MTAPLAVPPSLLQVQARIASLDARLRSSSTTSSQVGSAASSFSDVLSALGGTGTTTRGTGVAPTAAEVQTAAQQYVGIPYVWGGTNPSTGLDCSGFTQDLMRRFGVELPRVSADQLRTGTPVADLASAGPGDLIGWDNGPRNVGADHVAVYLGNGMMAEAPGTGGKVQIVPVRKTPDYIRRVLPGGGGDATVSRTARTGDSSALDPTTPYADLFAAAGQRHGVDPKLLALIAQRESSFDPRAGSSAGAQGLMQLMPATARGLGVNDPYDPAQAIDGAARLLRGHLDAFGSVDKAVAAYNAGSGAVRRYGGVPPFEETQKYVQWIDARYQGTGSWT
jgi:cell wall-associated NlpC family hydrolase